VTLRTRLLSGFAIVLAIVALGAVLLIRSQSTYLTEQVDRQLQSAMGPIMRPPGPLSGPSPGLDRPVPAVPGEGPISDLFIGSIRDGRLVALVRGQLLDDEPLIATDEASWRRVANTGPFSVDGVGGTSRFRVLVVLPDGQDAPAVVALPLGSVDDAVDQLTLALFAGTLVIAAILGLIVWWVERLGLRPIGRLTATADVIARGERGHRAPSGDPRTEAGKLATAFNVMLDERDASEERLRRFVADASHELRTPLTSIRGYLDLYQDGEFRSEPGLGDMMRRMAHEASRMGDLVEDLILLARLDEGRPLRAEPVDLGRLLDDAALDARVLQPDRTIVVTVAGGGPMRITGDLFRLQQVVGALVANALSYTEVDTRIELSARFEGDRAIVTVADDGPGLDAETAGRVFDRFVRGEQSRSRRSGGAGLGLAIAKAIVEAHGGTITLDTAPGTGCRFMVSLPRLMRASDA
jgi:two-component system OmpR family sensor kinase